MDLSETIKRFIATYFVPILCRSLLRCFCVTYQFHTQSPWIWYTAGMDLLLQPPRACCFSDGTSSPATWLSVYLQSEKRAPLMCHLGHMMHIFGTAYVRWNSNIVGTDGLLHLLLLSLLWHLVEFISDHSHCITLTLKKLSYSLQIVLLLWFSTHN